jgi:hypothetical protein
MENPAKVSNIVEGQLDRLLDIYSPILRKFDQNNWIEIQDSDNTTGHVKRIKLRQTEDVLQQMFDTIPQSLKDDMKKSVKQLSMEDLTGDLRKNLERLVSDASKSMILSGMYSTNPVKGLLYLGDKFKKGRK